MNPTQCTVSFLKSLPNPQLFRLARRVVTTLAVSRLLLGRCLMVIDSKAAEVGCSGGIHYAILQGVDAREALEARRVARRLEELPILREAAEVGSVGWACLREIVRKATADTEQHWLDLARRLNYRKVERIVRRTRVGEVPVEHGGAEAEPVETLLQVLLSPEEMAIHQRVMRLLSQEHGRPISFKESLLALWAEMLAGSYAPEAIQKIWDEAARDVAAQQPARVDDEAPWAAVAADEVECPGAPEVSLVRAATPHWSNDRLRFNPEARVVTPAQRQEVLRRDAYCCSTPGCPNHLWLEVHHVVFYAAGGVTVPSNLTLVCGRCHNHIHDGSLRLSGSAPDGLVWKDRRGYPLGGTRMGEWFGLLPEDLESPD